MAARLDEPAVRERLTALVGDALPRLRRNLNVTAAIAVVGGALSVSGNAPHRGGEEEAVVCVAPSTPAVQGAVLSGGPITVRAAVPGSDGAPRCIKDWITQVNSGHLDRLRAPANVRVVGPRQ